MDGWFSGGSFPHCGHSEQRERMIKSRWRLACMMSTGSGLWSGLGLPSNMEETDGFLVVVFTGLNHHGDCFHEGLKRLVCGFSNNHRRLKLWESLWRCCRDPQPTHWGQDGDSVLCHMWRFARLDSVSQTVATRIRYGWCRPARCHYWSPRGGDVVGDGDGGAHAWSPWCHCPYKGALL